VEGPASGSARSLQKWLGSLRDIEGILGSFFVSSEGEVMEADFPPAFEAVAFSVGQRVTRLRDALSLEGGNVSMLTVRYPNHKLALRSVSGGALVVLAGASVNDAALRSAMHLVGQRCGELGADGQAFTPGPPSFAPGPPAFTPGPPPLREPTQTLVSSVPIWEAPRPPSAGYERASSRPNPASSEDRPSSADRPSYPDRPSVNPLPPEAGLPMSSRKPRSVYFRGKRIG